MKKIFNLLLLSFVMIVTFASCSKDEDTPRTYTNYDEGKTYKIVIVTYDLEDTSTKELKNAPDKPAVTITMKGVVANEKFESKGHSTTFDLKKGEGYHLFIKASRSTWFKTYTYVDGKLVKWTSSSCPGLEYQTFDTRRD